MVPAPVRMAQKQSACIRVLKNTATYLWNRVLRDRHLPGIDDIGLEALGLGQFKGIFSRLVVAAPRMKLLAFVISQSYCFSYTVLVSPSPIELLK
jgi:hypothetical protein